MDVVSYASRDVGGGGGSLCRTGNIDIPPIGNEVTRDKAIKSNSAFNLTSQNIVLSHFTCTEMFGHNNW